MTKAEFLALLDKCLAGTASTEERGLLDNFYRRHLAESEEEWTFTEKERVRVEVLESLNRAIDEDVRHQRSRSFRNVSWVAASVVILMTAGLWLFMTETRSSEIRYLTTSTQRGERVTVTLSDGTVVQLNAESSITYPEQMQTSATRSIQLSGEAFFDVTRDEERPFVIQSGNLITTVLGTSFNIHAYPDDETIAVTVATGKVKVEAEHGPDAKTQSEFLGQGDQVLFTIASSRMERKRVALEKPLAWRNGTILLEGASLKEATDILERWYDVDFIFENPAMEKCAIDGKFRNDELANILENLRFLLGIEYRMEEGNKVFINGKSCD